MTTDANTSESDWPIVTTPASGVTVRQEIDNIGWVDLGGRAVIVDALERPELADEVLSLLAETLGDTPVSTVLNTHTHYDHVALNGLFQKRFGARIVNAKTTEIPAEGLRIEGTLRTAEFIPMPDCHTPQDCIVWIPEERVLFVGDIFGWGLVPWDRPLDRAKADYLLACHRQLVDLGPLVVIPGHGPLCGRAELVRWVTYFRKLIERVHELQAAGLSREEVRDGAIPPPEDMQPWWRFLKWKHQDSVNKVSHAVFRGVL